MDLSLNDDQRLLHDTARSFALSALEPKRIRTLEESENGFDHGVWKEMAEMGWSGAVFPEQYGGADAGFTELALVVEALGYGAIPSPIYSSVIEAGLLILDIGSPAQCETWLPRISAGDAILTTAVIERGGGLDSAQIRATSKPSGNGFVVNGIKLFVRDAGAADAIIVAARTGEQAEDIGLVMIPTRTAGVTCERLCLAGGEALWQVRLENVYVDSDAVLGDPGCGWPAVRRMHLRGAAFKSAELVGIGHRSLDLTLAYANTRQQFGGPIGRFQAVHHHCADMYRDAEVCRLLVWQAAAALAEDPDRVREVSIAKAKCSEAIPALTRMAHQIHGAIAYYRDYPLELFYHRAIAAQAAYGDARHHRNVLSALLRTNMDAFRGDDRHELPVHHV